MSMSTFGFLIAIAIAGAGVFFLVYEVLFETGILHRIYGPKPHRKKPKKHALIPRKKAVVHQSVHGEESGHAKEMEHHHEVEHVTHHAPQHGMLGMEEHLQHI